MALPENLRPASFRGVGFKVEVGARGGGRRPVMHEYPHRDDPTTEDMGRKGRRFQITGYLIGKAFRAARDELIAALEAEGPAQLIHPTLGEFEVQAGPYNAVERKERGGYVEIDFECLEAGSTATPIAAADNTQGQVEEKAKELSSASQAAADKELLSV